MHGRVFHTGVEEQGFDPGATRESATPSPEALPNEPSHATVEHRFLKGAAWGLRKAQRWQCPEPSGFAHARV